MASDFRTGIVIRYRPRATGMSTIRPLATLSGCIDSMRMASSPVRNAVLTYMKASDSPRGS